MPCRLASVLAESVAGYAEARKDAGMSAEAGEEFKEKVFLDVITAQ